MMSVNEYLILSDTKYLKAGSIWKLKEDQIKSIKANPKNQIIELSVEESLFYKIYTENVRIERHHADLFNKAKLLQKNFKGYLKIKNENVKIKIMDRDDRKSEPIFKCKHNGEVTKFIPMSAIEDVFSEIDFQDQSKTDSAESPEPVMKTDLHENKQVNQIIKDGYYLLSRKYSMYKCGAIIRVRDGKMTNTDDDKVIMDIEGAKDSLINIEEDETRYLIKVPKEKRMKRKENGIFSRIKNLHVGEQCNLKGKTNSSKIYKVTEIKFTHDGIKFDLRLQGSNLIEKNVDESQITFRKKESQKISAFLSSLSPSTSGSNNYGRQGIPKTIFCEPIHGNVINPTQIKRIQLNAEEKLDKYIVINIKSKSSVVKLLWKGLVDDLICLGCDLLVDWSIGTDGEFNDHPLFSCDKKSGVLIPVDDNLNACESIPRQHNVLSSDTVIINVIIREDDICCVETARDQNIYLNKTIIGDQNCKIKGICKWTGLVNGRECVMIVSDMPSGNYQCGGIVDNMKLCPGNCSNLSIIETKTLKSYKFVNDLFLENTSKIDEKIISRETNKYKIGQLIQAGEDPVFCGLVEFFLKYSTDDLVGLKVNEDQISKYVFGSKIKFEAPLFKRNDFGIIVKTKGTEALKEEVELMNNSKFIKPDSIKYKERCHLQLFKIGDIVKLISGEPDNCFRLDDIWMFNKVPCVEVSKATKMNKSNSVKYVRAQDIVKCDASDIQTRYFQDTIIDCESVKVWEKVDLPNISVRDKVEFVIRKTEERCKGIVQHVGKANKIASCIVQLLTNFGNANAYRINETKSFMKYCKNIEDPMVIIPADVLQKYNRTVTTFGIPIIEPEAVKTAKGKETSKKYIAFKTNKERHFVLLKWKGFVNGIYCFGGEIDGDDQLGTNGTFAGKPLFKCKEKCGVLILSDEVTDCCLNKNHNDWMIKKEKIVETSICCIKTKAKLNENNQITIHERLQKKNSNVTGVCIWMGLVNNKEAVFIEFGYQIPVGSDGGKDIFHFPLSRGAFFGASGFAHELEQVPGMAIKIINPFNIKAIENGKEIKKIICTKVKQKIETLNLKWRGFVNGELCVGCQLTKDVEYGTDGCYLGSRLFTCPGKTGVLIPVDQIGDSCELTGIHTEIEKNQVYLSYLRGVHKTLKFDSVCCIEWLENIQKLPHLCIDSRVKYKDLTGTCKWIGLMNGKEVVGVEMDKEFREGTNGTFDTFDLFTSDPGKGCLFMAEDIIHDSEYEKNLMQKYFMRLLSESTDEQLRSDILTDLISSDQINMIESFIGCHQNRTNFEIYPNLLPYLVKKKRFNMIKVILELVNVTEKSDVELLYIANEALKKNQDEIFHLALDKCSDKNVLLKNGETFLTNLFKEGYSEIDINHIIDKGIFKVDIPNVKGESPLLLACKHVMVSIVAKLLLNRPISVNQRAEAIKGAIDATNVPLDNIRKIVTLLNESETLASAECPICMNGIVNVSFQCGHCSCNTCCENLITCPICNIDILNIHRFYL